MKQNIAITIITLCFILCCSTITAQTYAPGQSAAGCNQTAVAMAYLNGLFSLPKDPSVFDQYAVDPAYNHNPLAQDGLKNLKPALLSLQKDFNYIRILRGASQGYLTFVHSKYYLNFTNFATSPSEPGISVVDIFRFTPNCKIIEHWDVNQQAVAASATASGNDMFSCVTCNNFTDPLPSTCDAIGQANNLFTQAFNNISVVDAVVNAQTYIQHNPGVSNGINAFKAFIPLIPKPPLGPTIRVFRGVQDGNYVYLHSRFMFSSTPTAAVDIFRFDSNCKIIEHWDILQTPPTYTASGNDLFSCLSCEYNPYPTSTASSPIISSLILFTICFILLMAIGL